MIIVGFIVVWIGYQQAVYGYVLLKGYDIRWRDLANPVHPYQWPRPPQTPALIPSTQILPGPVPKAGSAAARRGSSARPQPGMA